MADKILNTRIQVLSDTTENLAAKNAVAPLKGEIVYDTDKKKLRIGDGTTALENLKFVGGDEAQNFVATITGEETDIEAINRVVGSNEIHAGDTAVVKHLISEGKYSYTAYVYDGTNWTAMDGNYNADNVYFDDDITYTVAIGTLAQPSGSAKFNAKGKNVKQVFSSLMAQEANPSKTNPAVTIGTQTNFGTFEIGTKKNLVYAATLSAGSYTYGPPTGITAQTWSAACDGQTLDTANGTFENVVAEATAKKVTVTATYNEGAIPVTNLGNPYPDGKIAAGSASRDSANFVGVRYMFWGPMTDADAALDSANIRALANKKATSTGTLTTFGAGAGAKKVVVAVPAGRKITKVLMPSALNADVTALFVKQGTQSQVNGAEDYAAAAYDVYVYQPASIDAGETYSVTIG